MASSPTSSVSAASLLQSLQTVLQHHTIQREELLRLIKFVEQTSGSSSGSLNKIIPTPREIELHSQAIQLQQSIGSLVEQLQSQKMRNAQLEKKLSDLGKKI